jgi:hypothetical protein
MLRQFLPRPEIWACLSIPGLESLAGKRNRDVNKCHNTGTKLIIITAQRK